MSLPEDWTQGPAFIVFILVLMFLLFIITVVAREDLPLSRVS